MSGPHYQAASDLLDDWRDGVLGGTPPVLFPAGNGGLSWIEIGPGLATLFGGAPGQGKTALVMQLVCEALEWTPTLRALVCNIEADSSVLLDRQLARLSDVDLTASRHRRLGAEHAGRIEAGMRVLERFDDRLAFVRSPSTWRASPSRLTTSGRI